LVPIDRVALTVTVTGDGNTAAAAVLAATNLETQVNNTLQNFTVPSLILLSPHQRTHMPSSLSSLRSTISGRVVYSLSLSTLAAPSPSLPTCLSRSSSRATNFLDSLTNWLPSAPRISASSSPPTSTLVRIGFSHRVLFPFVSFTRFFLRSLFSMESHHFRFVVHS